MVFHDRVKAPCRLYGYKPVIKKRPTASVLIRKESQSTPGSRQHKGQSQVLNKA